ncbi:MAG TPA: DUF1009 domain-containing protein [Phycisphaerales bacterium]|nr:DUF1009 domain-containing protein [Phycisphaerales bacterium]
MPSVPVILPDPPAPPEPLGLIAAGGRLPIIVARGMASHGHPVHALGFRGLFPDELPALCAQFREVGALRIGSWGRMLRRMGVRYAVMVGRVDKSLLNDWRIVLRNSPDLRAVWMYLRTRRDRRSHAILGAIARELERDGVMLIDSTAHIGDQMAQFGVMTARRPSPGQMADIDLGWPLLQEMLRLDIGQAIAVRERDVVAVEALEGTDRMIERAGQLTRANAWSLLKGARAGHDRRSDVPTVGPDTITNLHRAGGRCLAIAAGDVIMVDRHDTLALADRLGVAVIGVSPV